MSSTAPIPAPAGAHTWPLFQKAIYADLKLVVAAGDPDQIAAWNALEMEMARGGDVRDHCPAWQQLRAATPILAGDASEASR